EWPGYYGSGIRPARYVEVKRIYHRNNPILLGSPPNHPPSDASYQKEMVRGALLCHDLTKMGVPDIRGVQVSEVGARQLVVISIKQRYAGHAKQAAILLSQNRLTAVQGRYVIVVDEDIDPTNIQEVLWALCTRSDPEKDIDIIRRAPSSSLDPIIRRPTDHFFNSRAIIDACKPYEWFNEFPQEIKISPELEKRVKEKFGSQLGL
ncbi:MAG: UbiD family decarboxylase, partial [Dehalococcoidia bacterium]|nr:UbiD family decarboxylase [Dehalococcoidia bacterium]